MTEGFDILSKMDPMARRALASMEAMTKAIELNNRDSLGKNLAESDFSQVGIIRKFDNSESSINQADGAVALGVVRAGRSDRIYRPHNVV